MAKPIKKIAHPILSEQEIQANSLEDIIRDAAANPEGLQKSITLLQELHDSGILEAVHAALSAKDKIVKITLGQVNRPPVLNMINNAMAVAGAITELDPEVTKKSMTSVVNGLLKAEEGLQKNDKIGVFDIVKALKDPDINRAMGFGLHLLKGIGQSLKD